MKRYFRLLNEKMNKQPFALVLDIYKSHISEAVKKYAKKLKIKLIFVPACGTDTFQPLDHRIFAVLKSKLEKNDKKILHIKVDGSALKAMQIKFGIMKFQIN